MTAHTGLYDTLGVPPDADAKSIKRAYRRKAAALHPDRNPGVDTTAAFNAVQTAYDVLSDPTRRQRYDDTGDETTGPTPAAIVGLVAESFTRALEQMVSHTSEHHRLCDCDLLSVVRGELNSRLKQTQYALKKSQQILADLKNMAGRFTVPTGGDNAFENVVADQIRRCTTHIYGVERDLELLERATAYAKNCTFAPIMKLDGEGGRKPTPQTTFQWVIQ